MLSSLEQRGATMLEFVIGGTLFLLLCFGLIVYGRMLAGFIFYNDVFYRLARRAVVEGRGCDAELASQLTSAIESSSLGINIASLPECIPQVTPMQAEYCEVRSTIRIGCEVCPSFLNEATLLAPVEFTFYSEHPDSCRNG